MRDLNDALHGIDGFSEFNAAAQGFIKGEIGIEQAIEVMTPFLQGDIVQDEQERERLIQLGQTIEAQCGWVSVTASVTACTPTFSCSVICC
ncbi:hypothetical protein E1287_32205 [Actinomadura sp. KC06]|uniref:hypothetical protein n=1 Tax=Actinomadura sp. KC06 TaxID=2530369 RepID=UPI0010532347|nr:hypothetical protein [Actinomadura sp. KC06]TDD28772.1 hypothetical protein E1287_32205 [Actinomadura sp. KC06]